MPQRIPEVRPGEPISAIDYNAMVRAVNRVSNLQGGGGIGLKQVGSGIALTADGQPTLQVEPAQLAWARNVGETTLSVFDVAAISMPLSTQTTKTYLGTPFASEDDWVGKRVLEMMVPEAHCFGRFCVVAREAAQNDVVPVFVSGACICRMARAHGVFKAGGNHRHPDRADTVAGQAYLQLNTVGAAQVLWMQYSDDDTETGAAWAIIRFDHRQTSGIGVWEYGNIANRGVAEVIQFDASVTVTEVAPGVVEISKA